MNTRAERDPRATFELAPGLWLDARRAVWLAEQRVLAVADLHLGYAWAHRHSGNLLPVSAREDTLERLRELVADYAPREVILLGDIVHRAVLVPALQETLCALFTGIGELAPLRLLLGNHDAQLARLLHACDLPAVIERTFSAGPHLLLHGDLADAGEAARLMDAARAAGGRVIIGHEHPAISLGDGVASRVRCPCFFSSAELLVLPAFSPWAAGTDLRGGSALSPFSRQVRFTQATAIVADKLLPMAL